MEAAIFSETLLPLYQTVRRQITEDRNPDYNDSSACVVVL
jgi:hypothetical protein